MSIWGRYFPRFCRWESWTQREVISLDPSERSLISTFFTYTERDWRMRCTWIMGFFGVPFKKFNYSPLVIFMLSIHLCAHLFIPLLFPVNLNAFYLWWGLIQNQVWQNPRMKHGCLSECSGSNKNNVGVGGELRIQSRSCEWSGEAITVLSRLYVHWLVFSSMSGWQFSGHSRYWIKQWSLSSPITPSDKKIPPNL